MAKQITLSQLRQASEKAKQYIDAQATAQVIKTETTLWNGDFRFSTSTLTPVTNDGNYKSFKGDTTNAGIVLDSAISDFDAIGFSLYIFITTENRFLSVEYVEIPVENLIVDGHFPINYATLFANFTNNNIAVTGIGLTATHRIGFGDWLVSNANWAMGVNKITGVKYTVPETYSTSEQIIGTWIDGKPLYQTTLVLNTTVQNLDYIPFNNEIETLVDYGGCLVIRDTNMKRPFPWYVGNGNWASLNGWTSTGIQYETNSDINAAKPGTSIWLKYTKTT